MNVFSSTGGITAIDGNDGLRQCDLSQQPDIPSFNLESARAADSSLDHLVLRTVRADGDCFVDLPAKPS